MSWIAEVDTDTPTLADGKAVPLRVNASGELKVTTTGGTSDAAAIGAVNETAPASDTASSGLNGRLQRIAQRLTSLIALLPASLGIKTTAGSLSIAPASDASFNVVPAGNVAHDVADSGNPVKMGGYATNGIPSSVTAGDRANLWLSLSGAVVPAGIETVIGGSASVLYQPDLSGTARQPAVSAVLWDGSAYWRPPGDATGSHVVQKGGTSGGLSPLRVVTGTTGVIKASAGQLYNLLSVRNANAAVRYLHLYNKATAPTLSTDTPVLTISLAASSVQNDIDLSDIGVAFSAGIAWAYTTDNIAIPATAGTSTELMFSGSYK